MPEARFLLLFLIATLLVLALVGLALFAMVHARNKIIQGQRRALEAERQATLTRQAFMDNAHHELKTPLQVIVGYLEMLRMTGLPQEQEAMVHGAQVAAGRLTLLVQGLLDLTAMADGTFTIRPASVDLRHLVLETAAPYGVEARAKGLAWSLEEALSPRLAWTDGPALQRLLGLLLDNALAYTESGSIALRAESRQEGNDLALAIHVDDTGRGLPIEGEGPVGRPFLDGRKSLSPTGALGLGLPLASGLAKTLGGELSLTRLSPGTRARIHLTLPIGGPAVTEPGPTGSSSQALP